MAWRRVMAGTSCGRQARRVHATDENSPGRENVLTIFAPVFFCREQKREREGWMGKRNRYYGISGTEYFERERLDYDREAVTQNGNIYM